MNITSASHDISAGSATGLMLAARVYQFGPPDVITFASTPRPIPEKGQVLVRVLASGVGPWDGWIRSGNSALPQPLPLTLGSDLSGIIEAVGPGVTGLVIGDAVFGVTNSQFTGANAEYAIADTGMIAKRPVHLDDITAAATPVVAVTALQALFDVGRLHAGQKVLIHGAAGCVGAYAVQLAHRARAHVIGTSNATDTDFVRTMGADEVIDYATQRFEDVASRVDLVIDLVGGETQQRSFVVLRPGGVLVSTVSQPDQVTAASLGVRAEFFLVGVTTDRLNRVAKMIDAGELVGQVGTVLPLDSIRRAHEMLEGVVPRTRGKIVLSH